MYDHVPKEKALHQELKATLLTKPCISAILDAYEEKRSLVLTDTPLLIIACLIDSLVVKIFCNLSAVVPNYITSPLILSNIVLISPILASTSVFV